MKPMRRILLFCLVLMTISSYGQGRYIDLCAIKKLDVTTLFGDKYDVDVSNFMCNTENGISKNSDFFISTDDYRTFLSYICEDAAYQNNNEKTYNILKISDFKLIEKYNIDEKDIYFCICKVKGHYYDVYGKRVNTDDEVVVFCKYAFGTIFSVPCERINRIEGNSQPVVETPYGLYMLFMR